MRFLHTSDWHLGAADGDRSLLEDQRYFIDEICRIVAEQGVDAVLLAGDVFDRAVASAEAIRLYDFAVTRLCKELGVSVLVIAGNHDSAERLASCGELLSSAGLFVRGTLTRDPAPVVFADAEVFLLPWITEERVKSVFPEEKEAVRSLEDAFCVVTAAMRKCFHPARRHILVAHAYVANAETSTSDRAAEIGFATQISADVLEGFDYVALGHIHKPQDITANIRYSGAPMPYSFGKEESQEKSVTIFDTSALTREAIALPLLHRRTTLTGTLEELLHPAVPEDIVNGYVRLRVTDSYVGLEALSELRAVYPCLLEVSGKTFEDENSSLSLTPEDLEKLETNPLEVFRFFCEEELGEAPDDHLLALFEKAVKTVEEALP